MPPASTSVDAAVQRAENLVRLGDWNGALAGYRTILQSLIRVDGDRIPPLRAGHLVVIDRFADLAAPLGYAKASAELLSAMSSLSSAAGDPYGRDYASVKHMLLEIGAGSLSEAHAILRSMTSTLGDIDRIEFTETGLRQWESQRSWPGTDEGDRATLFSQLYLALGSLLASLGSYGESLQALRRGLRFTGSGSPDLAQRAGPALHAAMAAALLEQGNLSEAGSELEPLSARTDEFAEPAHYVRVREILAKLHLLRGKFGLAQAGLRRIVQLCEEHGFAHGECRARLNLAQVLIFLNKTTEASANLRRAVSLAQAQDDDAMLRRATGLMSAGRERLASLAEGVSIAQSVASMWMTQVEDAPAAAALPDHLDLPQAANYLAFFEDRLLGAHWELGRGRLGNARILLADMRRTFGVTDSFLIAARLDAFDALLLYYERNYQGAAVSLRRLLPLYAERGLKPELWQLQRVLQWCLARTNAPRAEQDALTAISESLLEDLTATLSPEDQAVYNLNKWTADEEYLAGEIDRLVAERKRADASPPPLRLYRRLQVARRLHALSHRIDRFKEELAQNAAQRGTAGGDSSLRRFVAEQLTHPADAATLKFLVLPDRVMIIERSRFHLRFGVSPVSRLQLQGLVRSWHEWTTGLRTGADLEAEAAASAKEIGASLQILPAIARLSSRIKSLQIVPDDSLHGFPFAVLKYQGQYLVERFALSIRPSDQEPEPRPRPETAKALFVGVSTAVSGLPPLTKAGEELAPFREWAGNASLTALADESATPAAVAAGLESSSFAHIACHGIYIRNQPAATGLVLAPHPPEHEVLSIADIASLRLESLRHLTLSSCWSADNFILPGRWAISFPQRFHLAGAETVLACLWEAEQSFAVPFFARYYSYLAELPANEALARTQRDCIGRKLPLPADLPGDNPIYWAGYRIYGRTTSRAGKPRTRHGHD